MDDDDVTVLVVRTSSVEAADDDVFVELTVVTLVVIGLACDILEAVSVEDEDNVVSFVSVAVGVLDKAVLLWAVVVGVAELLWTLLLSLDKHLIHSFVVELFLNQETREEKKDMANAETKDNVKTFHLQFFALDYSDINVQARYGGICKCIFITSKLCLGGLLFVVSVVFVVAVVV